MLIKKRRAFPVLVNNPTIVKTIDIRTTQNVTIEYALANLLERFLSFFLDLIIVAGIYLVLFLLFAKALGEVLASLPVSFYFFLIPFGLFVLYYFLTELLLHGQTLGKRVTGLKVVRIDGQEPGLSDYLLRAIFHMPDTLISGGVLAALFISSTPRRQRLGDLAAHTTVIKARPTRSFRLEDILRISSLDDYEPRYPNVRQLAEADMLLIKTTLNRYEHYPNAAHRAAIEELVAVIGERAGLHPDRQNKVDFLKTLIRDYIVLTR